MPEMTRSELTRPPAFFADSAAVQSPPHYAQQSRCARLPRPWGDASCRSTPEWPLPARCPRKQARDSLPRRVAFAQHKNLIRVQFGNTISIRFKIVDQKNMLDLEIDANWSESSAQGRLVSFRRPWRTGPGTPKQAARRLPELLAFGQKCFLRPAPGPGTPGQEIFHRARSAVVHVQTCTRARSTLVPPTSPARIIARSPVYPTPLASAGAAMRQQPIEQHEQPAALRLNQLRWKVSGSYGP